MIAAPTVHPKATAAYVRMAHMAKYELHPMVLASTAVARSAVAWLALTSSMLLVRLVVHRNGRCRLQNASRYGATLVCNRAGQAQIQVGKPPGRPIACGGRLRAGGQQILRSLLLFGRCPVVKIYEVLMLVVWSGINEKAPSNDTAAVVVRLRGLLILELLRLCMALAESLLSLR